MGGKGGATFAVLLLTVFALAPSAAKTLDIWFIDVEGGQSTLIVTPAGESMLIDAGYSGKNPRGGGSSVPGGRDPNRILATLTEAGVSRIDYLLVTHFHPDHAGGVPALADRIPIEAFIDYDRPLGTPIGADRMTRGTFADYAPVRDKAKHLVPRAGARLPFKGVDATVVSAAGSLVANVLPEGGETNTACRDLEDFPEDGTENYLSVGVLFTFGAFRFLDVGDLSGNILTRLACPTNRIGRVSVYLVSHHGDYDTNVPAL